jgi:hypothetical protein
MKITIENTEHIAEIKINNYSVPARIWKGKTESGIEVFCFITRIAVSEDAPREVHEQFAKELAKAPTNVIYPKRNIEADK